MKRHTAIALILVLLCSGLVSSLKSEQKTPTLDDLSLQILESLQSFYPVRSTEMGIHSYDHRLADYSSSAVKKMIEQLKGYEKKLFGFQELPLSDYDRINCKLIKSNVDVALLDLQRIKWHERSPQLYVDDAVNGVYFLMLSQHQPLSEKVVPIVTRMKAVGGLFAVARKNLKDVPRVYIDAAQRSLESGQQFYQEVAAQLMHEFPERADDILEASTAAREAMGVFSDWLSKLSPGSDISFAIGRENFDYKLEHEYFLSMDADSLLHLGEALLAEAQKAYAEYQTYVDSNHRNGADSVFVPTNFTKQDILEYYDWETRQIRIFLEQQGIITVPEDIAPVSVMETPPFLRTMISGIAYQPAGPFDTVQQGYFYVRPIPDDLDREQLEARYRYVHRRGFKGSVVHEAYPGHHLQLQICGRPDDPVRKWQINNMMVEGWALYCEEMMYRAGLYGKEDPAQWLGVLGGIRFRAARIVADVKLHTGQFTYDECVTWMIEALNVTSDSDKEYIRTEVRRYTLSPTYQMSYLMGKREIMALRQAAERRDGDKFSLKAFHDALLAEGSIPPTLMWDVMGLSRD
ncbi:MAG TPA: DUF885 domain-containing protein [Candidatus Deferrimicrobium sp.]|nr:DUF885 domain-containing protein [Candidatus Deferrimicrobium sp.]